MRIGIDATTVAPGGKGHALTQRKTVEALASLGSGHELVAFVRGPEAAELLSGIGVVCVQTTSTRMLVWEQIGLPLAAARLELDVVLTLTDRLPLRSRARYVVWLFEVPTHRIRLARASGAGLYWQASDLVTRLMWKRSLRRAARVVAGSEATAREIHAAVPDLSGPVRVVYPGLRDGFDATPGPADRSGRYVLHLSSSDPRDNTETVIEAFAAARSRVAEVKLVVAGGLGERRDTLERRIRELGIVDQVELPGYVTDDRLVSLYRGASAYLDATLYEGFGYQVLEAMACGAPVVGSSASSIPEVVADAGLLCDPRNAAELAAALVRVLEDDVLARELRGRGLQRAATFTWDRTARALAAVLEDVR